MFLGKAAADHDRILDFSTAVTGTLFFVPSAEFLDDPPSPSEPAQTARSERDGDDQSLGIGSLRDLPG
jgi:porphyrinogen peroxidase